MRLGKREYVFDVACCDCGTRYQQAVQWNAPVNCRQCQSTFIATKAVNVEKEHVITVHVTATDGEAERFQEACANLAVDWFCDPTSSLSFEGAFVKEYKHDD